jgi:hypothetical protein
MERRDFLLGLVVAPVVLGSVIVAKACQQKKAEELVWHIPPQDSIFNITPKDTPLNIRFDF